MKIIATSDTHFPINKSGFFPNGDILVIAGDFLYSGTEREWYPFLESLKQPFIQRYKHKLIVPGNHDIFFSYYPGPCIQELKAIGFTAMTPTKPVVEIDGIRFGSSPYVTGLPNWAYNTDEDYLWDYLQDIGRVEVMISHSPPRGVLDSDGKGNWGVSALRKYMSKFEPEVVICGHVHEQGGKQQQVGRTLVCNVAMCDEDYQQVNPAIEVDV